MTFPAHQGLILPVVRRWPNSFDALALSVGAAMPDITDTILGFPINGYFKQWYGHSLIGIFTLDFAGGLFITWLIAALARRSLKSVYIPKALQAFLTKAPPTRDPEGQGVKLYFTGEIDSSCGVSQYWWVFFPTCFLISSHMIRICCSIPGMKMCIGFQNGGTQYGLNFVL